MILRQIALRPRCITCGLPITPRTPARRIADPERAYAVRQHLACAQRRADARRAILSANGLIWWRLRAHAAGRGRGRP